MNPLTKLEHVTLEIYKALITKTHLSNETLGLAVNLAKAFVTKFEEQITEGTV